MGELSWVINDILWAVADLFEQLRDATWGERLAFVGVGFLGYAVLFMVACLG